MLPLSRNSLLNVNFNLGAWLTLYFLPDTLYYLQMVAKIIVTIDKSALLPEIEKILMKYSFNLNHPDLLYISDKKLGIEQARLIKEHFSYKPYQAKGKALVIEEAHKLTMDAQNALLKTLEELTEHSLVILGSNSIENFLPTILSRCQVVQIGETNQSAIQTAELLTKYQADLDSLLKSDLAERFGYIEKLKDKAEFLDFLTSAFHQKLSDPTADKKQTKEFLDSLLEAQKWQKQNVNIRGILEYLMLKL